MTDAAGSPCSSSLTLKLSAAQQAAAPLLNTGEEELVLVLVLVLLVVSVVELVVLSTEKCCSVRRVYPNVCVNGRIWRRITNRSR